MKEEIKSRLASLRELMKNQGIAAVIIPQKDAHMSEYLSDFWQVRRYFSSFTGSAGDLVVTADEAYLWTDSRYFLQAAQQLEGTGIGLMKDGLLDTPSITDWLIGKLKSGGVVGIDGMVFSSREKADMQMRLAAEGISLVSDFDAASVWTDRPALPQGKIFEHELKYAGLEATAKIAGVLAKTASQKADAVFISALDEIAWVLNIRSNDVEYNPVATSFLYLSASRNVLFIDPAKVAADMQQYLLSQNVECRPYTSVKEFLAALPSDVRVLVEAARTAASITDILGTRVVSGESPVAMDKACKNDVQIQGVRDAMVRDGVAMVRSLREIHAKLDSGEKCTEMDIADILRRNRARSLMFFDESFGTIAGYGPHGAIVHYEADADSNVELKREGLLLIDSGAQYFDGTTDLTRTICLGDVPTADERRDFTLVMKGHIALATAIFPAGTCGAQLDALARQFLWKEGLSYLHGTGHGVGHFLNVHEGPQSIRLNYVPTPLTPGMITSDEPGLYREGVHGIRCENLVLTVPAMSTEFGDFYQFEVLTRWPCVCGLLETAIWTNEEVAWYNAYQLRVRETLAPHLDGEDLAWLNEQTQPVKLHN